MDDHTLLDVKEISVVFGGVQPLTNVSLSLKAGEILGLIGPNGAGKTVFLNCLCGIYTPETGRIFFEGRDVTGFSPEILAQMGIGRSFQMIELFSDMTVIENTLVGRHIKMKNGIFSSGLYWGSGRKEEIMAREKAEEIVAFLELSPYRKARVGSLSYGIQKLVGLSRALAMEPKILLLDEVGSGLSRDEREHLARFLLRIVSVKQIPIIWVEHDLKMVCEIANRLVCFNYGIKIADGPPEVVVNDPLVVEAYTGLGKK